MVVNHIAKFKKYHKQKIRLKSTTRTFPEPRFGTFALRAKESTRFAEHHYETVQRLFKRHSKKIGCLWFPGNPNRPISAKPTNIRMGKGKGATAFWVHMVPTGAMIAEGTGLNYDSLAKISQIIQKKLPNQVGYSWVRTRFHK